MKSSKINSFNRRDFFRLTSLGIGTAILNKSYLHGSPYHNHEVVQLLDKTHRELESIKVWTPVSDRKIRVGLVGYGQSRFAADFGFQNHPNVEVAAVSDLIPERCNKLAEVTKCSTTYPSLKELLKDSSIEAVFVATDAPSHAQHCIETLNHGKHVACACPAVFGSLEDAEKLFETVKRTGLKYMMFETSMYRENLYAMNKLYKVGGFGKLVYAEGEYWHYSEKGIPSFKDWRHGMPPQWYSTHSDAYYVGVTEGHFLEVSCLGLPSTMERYQPKNNIYGNPFATEIAFYRTSEGGMARMGRSSDTMGNGYGSETGRVRGTQGSYYEKYDGILSNLPDISRPALPPDVPAGGHGGSHGHLTEEFVRAILEDRDPWIDIAMSLNLTVGGIVAHQSAMRDGEWLKIPHFTFK